MKKAFLILTLTGILLQTFSRALIILNFELNRDRIAQTLCEKKDIPNNCCQGNCHIRKILDKHDKNEQAPGNVKNEKEITLFCCQQSSSDHLLLLVRDLDYIPYPSSKTTASSCAVFHPPQC